MSRTASSWSVFNERQHPGIRGYSIGEFENNFAQICAEHKAQNRALIFALVLCDDTFPQMAMVLEQPGYMRALDLEAGNLISVFFYAASNDGAGTDDSDYLLGLVLPVYGARGAQSRFRSVAGPSTASNRDLPSILFVQVDNGAITHTLTVKLKARMVEPLVVEVQDIIETAATSLKQECIDRLKGDADLPSGQSNSPSLDTSSNAMPSAGS